MCLPGVELLSYTELANGSWIISCANSVRISVGEEDQITCGEIVDSLLGIKFDYDDDKLSRKLYMPGFITNAVEEFGLQCGLWDLK